MIMAQARQQLKERYLHDPLYAELAKHKGCREWTEERWQSELYFVMYEE